MKKLNFKLTESFISNNTNTKINLDDWCFPILLESIKETPYNCSWGDTSKNSSFKIKLIGSSIN